MWIHKKRVSSNEYQFQLQNRINLDTLRVRNDRDAIHKSAIPSPFTLFPDEENEISNEMSNKISFASFDRSEHPWISESRPGQLDLCTRAQVNLFILGAFSAVLCSPLLPSSLFFSKIQICVASKGQVCTESRDENREEVFVVKDEDSSEEEKRWERERSARAAMRRWLRHHHGVRRISCEPGNTSQLTAGRTVDLARAARGSGAPTLRQSIFRSAPVAAARCSGRSAFSLILSLWSFSRIMCRIVSRISLVDRFYAIIIRWIFNSLLRISYSQILNEHDVSEKSLSDERRMCSRFTSAFPLLPKISTFDLIWTICFQDVIFRRYKTIKISQQIFCIFQEIFQRHMFGRSVHETTAKCLFSCRGIIFKWSMMRHASK